MKVLLDKLYVWLNNNRGKREFEFSLALLSIWWCIFFPLYAKGLSGGLVIISISQFIEVPILITGSIVLCTLSWYSFFAKNVRLSALSALIHICVLVYFMVVSITQSGIIIATGLLFIFTIQAIYVLFKISIE